MKKINPPILTKLVWVNKKKLNLTFTQTHSSNQSLKDSQEIS